MAIQPALKLSKTGQNGGLQAFVKMTGLSKTQNTRIFMKYWCLYIDHLFKNFLTYQMVVHERLTYKYSLHNWRIFHPASPSNESVLRRYLGLYHVSVCEEGWPHKSLAFKIKFVLRLIWNKYQKSEILFLNTPKIRSRICPFFKLLLRVKVTPMSSLGNIGFFKVSGVYLSSQHRLSK